MSAYPQANREQLMASIQSITVDENQYWLQLFKPIFLIFQSFTLRLTSESSRNSDYRLRKKCVTPEE